MLNYISVELIKVKQMYGIIWDFNIEFNLVI